MEISDLVAGFIELDAEGKGAAIVELCAYLPEEQKVMVLLDQIKPIFIDVLRRKYELKGEHYHAKDKLKDRMVADLKQIMHQYVAHHTHPAFVFYAEVFHDFVLPHFDIRLSGSDEEKYVHDMDLARTRLEQKYAGD